MISRALTVCFTVLALVALPAIVHAQSVREVAVQVHERGDYGDHLRASASPGEPGIDFGGSSAAPEREARPRPPRTSHAPPPSISLGAAGQGISYVVLGIALVAIVALFVVLLARTRRDGVLAPPRTQPTIAPDISAIPGGGRVALDADPDALAAEGRLADAITAALIQGLYAVGWRPEGHGKSRTAREILGAVQAGDARRRTLAELVGVEERVAFGGDEATPERWQEARAHWIALRDHARGEPT